MIIDNKEYKEITIRGRTKLIARDGSALNPIRRNQKCTTNLNDDGYPCFGGGIPVHLYVAYGWVDGYFEGAEVNHIDFDRTNYNYTNLEWVTHVDNIKHSVINSNNYSIGNRGINNGHANFTEEQVVKIRELYDNGMSVADILRIDYPELKSSKDYKNIHSTYLNICKRKTWKHIA